MKIIYVGNVQDKDKAVLEDLPQHVRFANAYCFYLAEEENNFPGHRLKSSRATTFYIDGVSTPEEDDALVQHISHTFPGQEVTLLTAVKSGYTPAGQYQVKQVTKDGVLPG